MNMLDQRLQHLDAAKRLNSLWREFRAIQRPRLVKHAHTADYSFLRSELNDLSIRASCIEAVDHSDRISRESLLRRVADEQANLEARVPQFVVESLCS